MYNLVRFSSLGSKWLELPLETHEVTRVVRKLSLNEAVSNYTRETLVREAVPVV